MPVLYVIAGPNGAGKSSYSTVLLPDGLVAFDGDKELLLLQQKFPATDNAQLASHVNEELFRERQLTAIKSKKDFAFETNFATNGIVKTVDRFRQQGYAAQLIYIGLPSADEAINRVRLRVRQGGHDVSDEQIKQNYTEGLKIVKENLEAFNKVLIMENPSKQSIGFSETLASYTNQKLTYANTDLPPWAKQIIQPSRVMLKQKNRSKRKVKRL